MDANTAATDVVAQLHAEHTYLASLFAELAREHDALRARGLFRTLYAELLAHSSAEEAVFYSALARSPAARALVDRARTEQKRIVALANELLATAPAKPGWRETARVLERAVAEHAAEKERELFPLARQELGGEVLAAMGFRLLDAAAGWREAECGGRHPTPSGGAAARAF